MPAQSFCLRAALLGLLAATTSCSEAPRTAPPVAPGAAPDTATVRKVAARYQVSIGEPTPIDSSALYYQPVGVGIKNRSREYSGGSTFSSDSGYEGPGQVYNLLFTSLPDHTTHLLFPHGRFLISEVNTDAQPASRYPYLFCKVVEQDTDYDGQLSEADASALYVADRAGYHARRLTQATAQVQQWLVLPNSPTLLVRLRHDTNHDREFDEEDADHWLRYDLRNLTAAPVPHPTTSVQEQLKQQMIEFKSRQKPDQD